MLWRPGTWPITIRIAAATAVLMIVLGFAASRQVMATLGRLQDDRLREYARLHVDGLAVALGPFVLHKDVWEVYDTLDRARTNTSGERILFTVVADDRGQVLAATDPLRAPVDSDVSAFASAAVLVPEVTAAIAGNVVQVQAPLSVQGREVGVIVSELDVSDLTSERRNAVFALLAGNAIVTAVLVLAGYLVLARMLRPVELLARHMSDAGDAPNPIPETAIPRSDTVLSKLLRNFNEMTGAIAARTEAEKRLADRERFVSLGRLSSSLAHEINNPLGGLLNATDTIRTYSDRPDVVQQSAELVDRGLRHLRDVSRVILEENRLDRSGRPLSVTDFEDLRLLFEPETTRRRQRLDWTVSAGNESLSSFPSAPVRQIAMNLLLNASSAAPEGGAISLRVLAHAGRIELIVMDDGPGLSDSARMRLLSEAPVEPGSGVGLRLVRDLVSSLSGSIQCERSEDRTAIQIDLPQQRDRSC